MLGAFKGQLISKGNLVFFIHPKNELENDDFSPSLFNEADIYRSFLGELKEPKSPFEIN